MSGRTVEFARLVPLVRLGGDVFSRHIAARSDERDALARRFDLVSLDRLEADVELEREPAGTILLTAAFEAEFAQRCIVTLDPVTGAVSERFQLRYGAPDDEAAAPNGDDDPAFEALEDDSIDIGEAVAQEFSLCLPPFPRATGAVVEAEGPEKTADGPFAALAAFRRREPQ